MIFGISMNIEKFVPFRYDYKEFDIRTLNYLTGKEWQYATNGKTALFHILKGLNVKGAILVPNYICDSILKPITSLGLETVYYDFNEHDLNADLIDLERKLKLFDHIECVLVASMYGNPANLNEITKICKQHNVKLIDDAAQAFGAKLNGKFLGTFGDGGFFSFSPGKPTPGHLGAFYWISNKDYYFKRKSHHWVHFLFFADFYFNRYKIKIYKRYKVFKLLSCLKILVQKVIDLRYDKMSKFENKIIGGVLEKNFNSKYRSEHLYLLKNELSFDNDFYLVTQGGEDVNNHKIVFVVKNSGLNFQIKKALFECKIYFSNGYRLLDYSAGTTNALKLKDSIIEIPLEEDVEDIKFLISVIKKTYYEFSCCNGCV